MSSFGSTFSRSAATCRADKELLLGSQCLSEEECVQNGMVDDSMSLDEETGVKIGKHSSYPQHTCEVDEAKLFFGDESEVHNCSNASDDDAVGVIASNPKFVRSFNKRVRSRELRGWRYKSLSGETDLRQPELKDTREKICNGPNVGSNSQAKSANVGLKSKENTENYQCIKTYRRRTVSGVNVSDGDSGGVCFPSTDSVFCPLDTVPPVPQQSSSSEFNDPTSSTGNQTIPDKREEHKSCCLGSTASTVADNEATSTCVDVEWHQTKDCGGGFSFLSRLGKSVSLKRKYGKSHGKTRPFQFNEKKVVKESGVKENLECIMENSQEKNMEECIPCHWPQNLCSERDGMMIKPAEEGKVPCSKESNSPSCSPSTRWFLSADPTLAEINTLDAERNKQCNTPVMTEASSFLPILFKLPPPPRSRKLGDSEPVANQNSTFEHERSCMKSNPRDPEMMDEKSDQMSLTFDQDWNLITSRCVGSTSSLWPALHPSTVTDSEFLCLNETSNANEQTTLCTVASATAQEAKSPITVRKTYESTCLSRQPQLPEHSGNEEPQFKERSSLQHTEPSHFNGLKEINMQKKCKFRPSFIFHTENNTKKSEVEKGEAKDKNVKKEKKVSGERKVTEVKASVATQVKLRRVGAIKKCEEIHHLLLDDSHVSLTSVLTIPHNNDTLTQARDTKPTLNSSFSIQPLPSTGAIPKSSQMSKVFQVINKDEAKQKNLSEINPTIHENTATDTKCQTSLETKKGSGKSFKTHGKRLMERSSSVPFWTKLYSQEISPSTADGECLTDNKLHTNGEKIVAHNTQQGDQGKAVQSMAKVTHKRAKSQELKKTFLDEAFSLAPERSASHDNITTLKQGASKVSSLDIGFQPSESAQEINISNLHFTEDASFERLGYKSHYKHASCNDIIDMGKETSESSRVIQAFRDSKVISASAFCLSSSVTRKASAGGGLGTPTPALRGKDSSLSGGNLPTSPSALVGDELAGETRNLRESQLLYTSPYDLVTNVRDKPYFQRVINVFHIQTTDSKMDSLVQQLDLYSKQGIPRQPHLLASQTPGNDDEVVVEDSWRTLVEGHDQLDERQEQQQSAIWELVETEATYIHMLKVITDLFLACLCNLQNESLLYEVDTDKLFSNIQEIYCANLTFWREHIVRMLEASRSTREPLDPTLLTDAFYKFDELFHPYTRYCLEQSNCQLYCKEKDHDNEYFKMYLAWCETQKECNRLRLVDILVQPMQRLTKYSLLLKAILKKTNLEDHKLCLHDMITHVENFVSNVNSALRHKHEQERLRDIAKRIEAYEAVARDDELERVVRNYSDLNLTQPMPGCPEHLPRHLLHHGDLRLRDPHTSKMDVHVFLFTDLLLITKVTQRKAEKVKIVRPPYHVERLVLVELKDNTSIGLVSINEWNVAVAAFTLQCPDQRAHRTWYDTLKRAKDQYREAQQAQDVVYDDITCVGHLVPRSPRPGSSRASRVSSLAHSHSGSIDLNETSPATQHHPSIDMSDVRASSASSDDSIAQSAPEIQRSRSLEGGGSGAISPRPDRRPGFPKTPNTLSVIPPYSTGQSLPNLTVESANSLLRVPGTNGSNPKALSPCTRGVSYPPPSPRTLRRSAPVPQSRNPPLLKSRHVTSMVGSPQDVDQNEQDDSTRGQRRTYRIDRMDNRRYHTAGAIDDIKKQNAKDASIHKRLSWNYGQGPTPSRDLVNDQGKLGRHKHSVKNISCESVHSSSGVSSTSSLHRSMGSEVEALENIDDNELEDGEATVVDLTVSDCTSLKISPHISTTYICHDSDITLGVCSQYITQPNCSPEPCEGCENLVKIDVSETDPGISSVQITVTEGAISSSSSNVSSTSPSESAPTKPDMRMREILLNDASVEASDV
ncbi:hypothetical protein OTU49_008702 [Cherax quadricarinatus]|uniref:DH domain-containing protein n=1 Tax=Cherax quadricarinatus TaxID=27406 RepID=A0AAW0WNB2_CHEQU